MVMADKGRDELRLERQSKDDRASKCASDDAKMREKGSVRIHSPYEPDMMCPRTPDNLTIHTPTKIDVDLDTTMREKLQSTLEKHGIERQNARNFFLGLVNDQDFKKMFMASMNSDSDEESCDENEFNARMTRSKLREFIQNSPHKVHWATKVAVSTDNMPKFTDIPLSENDDDDDNYQPIVAEESFENEEPIWKLSSLDNNGDVQGDKNDLSQQIQPIEKTSDEIVHQPDYVSKYTRSKHSLKSTSLDVIQAAFNPPDVADDMLNSNVESIEDYDWQKWLVDLMSDYVPPNNDEDDNIDEDPDYNIAAEMDNSECEDTQEIPWSELQELFDELENPNSHPHQPEHVSSTPLSKPVLLHATPMKENVYEQRKKAITQVQANFDPILRVSNTQIELIEQQMQQHVQLLLQSNLLCRNTIFGDIVEDSREMLHELNDIAAYQMQSLGLEKSYASPANLSEALNYTKISISPSDPLIRLHRIEKLKRHVPIPTNIGKILGNSRACMYRELLPMSSPVSRMNSKKMPCFTYSEDCLLVLGVAEMKNITRSYFDLITQHMLPIRTSKQLSARFRNVSCCRNLKDTMNPITKYRSEGVLPKPNTEVKHIHHADAQRPLDMEGNLPCWVYALRPLYETRSSHQRMVNTNTAIPTQPAPHYSTDKYEVSKSELSTSDLSITTNPSVALHNTSQLLEPLNLQAKQISVFQTYNSVYDKDSVCDMKTDVTATYSSSTSEASMNTKPFLQGENTSTSQALGMISTSMVQPSAKYGRRRSAGKSIKRMRKELMTSSSSSESEDDLKINEKIHKPHVATENSQRSVGKREGDDPRAVKIPKAVSNEMKEGPPVGGYLQKVHPRLLGKKSKMSTRDISKIKSSANMLKTLEDDSNVISDPRHDEKEKIFATGYLTRVKRVLSDQPGKYEQFLAALSKFTDNHSSPENIFKEIAELLKNWPDLIQGFVPFLLPSQAQECGLSQEKDMYVRARRFLRQLEMQFHDNQEHLDKILAVFHCFSETAVYREEEMLKCILNLLKGHPYLQDAFVTFFDNQPPPKMLFEDDFEEVDLTEDALKDTNANQFEYATLSVENLEIETAQANEVASRKKTKKRKISQSSPDGRTTPQILPSVTDNKENIEPSTEVLEDEGDDMAHNYDSESDDAITEDESTITTCIAIPPPNMAMINEDAQSSSPFKRITGESEPILRPRTPTGIAEGTSDTIVFSASSFPLCASSSSSFPVLPATPGKIPPTLREYVQEPFMFKNSTSSPALRDDVQEPFMLKNPTSSGPVLHELKQTQSEQNEDTSPGDLETHVQLVEQSRAWNRNEDELLLTNCRQGINDLMFNSIAQKLGRNVQDVQVRLHDLLDLFNADGGAEMEHESDEDVEELSDSSEA